MASRLDRFRQHKDEYFSDGDNSPIDDALLDQFSGLTYFPEHPELEFTLSLDVSSESSGDLVELETSDGLIAEFRRAGTVSFQVNGENVSLTVLKDMDRGRFFLPFTDLTSGKVTYGGGRYLDPQADRDGNLIVDFNYSYNPYCAYSDGWSCPLPPSENALDVEIPAGEKNYVRPEMIAEES
ncbi:DUF1684 domain-containing protein [soil metagenome]